MKALMEESRYLYVCRRGYNAIFSVYQDRVKALQNWKIPGKVLEFFPDQRGRIMLTCYFELSFFRKLR